MSSPALLSIGPRDWGRRECKTNRSTQNTPFVRWGQLSVGHDCYFAWVPSSLQFQWKKPAFQFPPVDAGPINLATGRYSVLVLQLPMMQEIVPNLSVVVWRRCTEPLGHEDWFRLRLIRFVRKNNRIGSLPPKNSNRAISFATWCVVEPISPDSTQNSFLLLKLHFIEHLAWRYVYQEIAQPLNSD